MWRGADVQVTKFLECPPPLPQESGPKTVSRRTCMTYHSDQIFYRRSEKILGSFWVVGNFYRCRLQIPRNFGSVTLAKLPTRIPVCLLNNAKSPVEMTDLKSKGFLGALVIFYRCRLQIPPIFGSVMGQIYRQGSLCVY